MAITTYTRAPKESDFSGVDPSRQYASYIAQLRKEKMAEEQRVYEEAKETRKRNEAEYMALAKDTKPTFTMSEYWQGKQVDYIKDLTGRLGEIYHRNNNKPSLDDRVEAQNLINGLATYQQNLQKQQKDYEAALPLIQKNLKGDLDQDKFSEIVDNWKKTGKMFYNDIDEKGNKYEVPVDSFVHPAKYENLGGYLEGKKFVASKTESLVNKHGQKEYVTVNAKPEEIKAFMGNILQEPRVTMTVMDEFKKLPVQEKAKYLKPHEGKDPSENTAILDYFYDKYNQNLLKYDTKLQKKSGLTINLGGGALGQQGEAVLAKGDEPIDYSTVTRKEAKLSPVKVGGVSISNENDYARINAKASKTEDEKDAIRTWAAQKGGMGEMTKAEKELPNWGNIPLTQGSVVKTGATKMFDNEGNPVKPFEGEKLLRDTKIVYYAYNPETGKIALKNEQGAGWDKRAFLLGKYKEGSREKEVAVPLTKSHVSAIVKHETTVTGKSKLPKEGIRLSLGGFSGEAPAAEEETPKTKEAVPKGKAVAPEAKKGLDRLGLGI